MKTTRDKMRNICFLASQGFWRSTLLLLALFLLGTSCVAARTGPSEDISIKTLPPRASYDNQYRAVPVLESADALLSDWKGEHWASLDADQDKVALSWSTTKDEAIFQVGHCLQTNK